MTAAPWITYEARKFLDQVFSDSGDRFNVMEWGGGHSTEWFSQHFAVDHVLTIESNPEWLAKISGLPKVIVDKRGPDHPGYASVMPIWLPNFFFVDGRRRMDCLRWAKRLAKPGAWLCLDNSERPRYADQRKIMAGLPHWRFFGPGDGGMWETTFWRIP